MAASSSPAPLPRPPAGLLALHGGVRAAKTTRSTKAHSDLVEGLSAKSPPLLVFLMKRAFPTAEMSGGLARQTSYRDRVLSSMVVDWYSIGDKNSF